MSDNKKNCYLFVHFKEKSTPDGEQVYFGISRDGVAGRGGQRDRGCSGDAGKRWATSENREREYYHGDVTP